MLVPPALWATGGLEAKILQCILPSPSLGRVYPSPTPPRGPRTGGSESAGDPFWRPGALPGAIQKSINFSIQFSTHFGSILAPKMLPKTTQNHKKIIPQPYLAKIIPASTPNRMVVNWVKIYRNTHANREIGNFRGGTHGI